MITDTSVPSAVSVIVQQNDHSFLFITGVMGATDFRASVDLTVAALGLLLAGICVCRMNALNPKVHKLKVRLHYLIMFAGSICVAGAPWFWPEYPRVGAMIFLASIVTATLLSTTEWRRGPPDSARANLEQGDLFNESSTYTRSVVSYLESLRRRLHNGWSLVRHFCRRCH